MMFGFTVYSSISQADNTSKIPYPTPRERVLGIRAVDAVGYDDNMKIKNDNAVGEEEGTTGTFLIRGSWGMEWGSEGYGWLPYEYVLKGLAIDWLSLLKNEWIDTGGFVVKELISKSLFDRIVALNGMTSPWILRSHQPPPMSVWAPPLLILSSS